MKDFLAGAGKKNKLNHHHEKGEEELYKLNFSREARRRQ
jgi:hypothetical protein